MSASNESKQTDRPTFPEFDPLVPDHEVDPWPLWKQAREEHPVFFMPQLGMYCVTRYEDVKTILRDPETFSNVGANRMRAPVPDGIEIPDGCPYPSVGDGLANLDAPRHTRLRKLMQPAFTRKRVAERRPQMDAIANALIDDFAADGEADLVAAFSNPLPIQTIAMVLGFPIEAATKFRRWTDSFFFLLATPDLSDERAFELWTDLLESDRYIRAHVESRRAEPGDDMVSDLITQESDDGTPSLTDDEIVANVVAFIAAGTDTTAILITQMVRILHREGLWNRVRDDRSLIPTFIEESLRYAGVVRGLNRVVINDTELSGVKIPAGSVLYWSPASANRDEESWEAPEKFDLEREHLSNHFAFSAQRHFCIGAPLSRVEAEVALESLFDRLPSLRVPDQDVEYHPNFVTPTPTGLWVEWDA